MKTAFCFSQKEAIAYSWELLTEVYKLPPAQLYVTYFEGDAQNGLEADLEARKFWIDQGIPEDHIIPGNAKDNFWGGSVPWYYYLVFTVSCARNGSYWSMRAL